MKSIEVSKRVAYLALIMVVVSLGFSTVAWTQVQPPPMVLQPLNYTENPVDVPNPDRGFERSNDDASGNTAGSGGGVYSYMRVPASASTLMCQPFVPAFEMSIGPNYQVQSQPFYLGGVKDAPGMSGYLDVPVYPRIIQFYLVLNQFSSNAWTDSSATNCASHTNVGVDGPITQYGLDYIASWLQFIRDNTNSVVHIRVNYDPKGWNQIVWDEDNLIYADSDTGHTNPFTTQAEIDANIAQPLPGTWRGSSPIYRMCTVPGFTNLTWVQYHYLQLAPIFQEYHDIIWAFDSGTFGPWGESHSNYEAEDPNNYKMALDSLLAAVPDGKIIMTHLGGFLAWYNRTYNTQYTFGNLDTFPPIVRGTPEARFGFFSDSAADFSGDEYSFNDDGSLSEGYRMLALDPTLPGYDATAVDPADRSGKCSNNTATKCTIDDSSTVCGSGNTCVIAIGSQSSGGGDPVIGYNDSGTNRLEYLPLPDGPTYTSTSFRAAWFIDFDYTKTTNFISHMADFGGEQIGSEPSGKNVTNGCFVPEGSQLASVCDNEIGRFPFMFYEHSIKRNTYLDMQQGSGSYASRAALTYTQANIAEAFTLPWSGQQVTPTYDSLYAGQSALAYYRDRMGFRFVLREAYASPWAQQSTGTLAFDGKIQNVGWGQVFNTKAVNVILKSPATGVASNLVLTSIDPYDWQPAAYAGPGEPISCGGYTTAVNNLSGTLTCATYGPQPDSTATDTDAWRDFNFSIPMSAFGSLPTGTYNIYLKIADPNEQYINKRSIQFANNGNDIWDDTIAANLIGSTTVTLAQANVVTFTTKAPASAAYGSSFMVAASGLGTGAITYSSDGVVCSNSGSTYTMIWGGGVCSLTATQAADANYQSAVASEYVVATQATDTVTFSTPAPSSAEYGASFTVAAAGLTGSSPATYSSDGVVCTNSGATYTMISGAGTCTVTATSAANSNYTSATSAPEYVAAEPAQGEVGVSLTSGSNPSTYGNSITFTATVTSDTGAVKGRKTTKRPKDLNGSVSWSGNTGCGASTVSGNPPQTATCTTSALLGGTDTVTATYTASDSNHTTGSGAISQTVNPTTNTVSFPTPAPSSAEYGSSFTVAASGLGTGAISYTSDGVVCSNSGATYTMISGSGTCTVTATQAADANYASANASENVTAAPAQGSVSVSLTSGSNPSTYGDSITFTATVTSDTGAVKGRKTTKRPKDLNGSVAWSGNTGCSVNAVSGNPPQTATCTMSILAGGTDTVTATYTASDSNHTTASGSTSQTVNPANQTITCPGAPSTATNKSSFTLECTAQTPLTYASSGVCTNVGATYTMTSGVLNKACNESVTAAASSNYTSATYSGVTTVASALTPTVSITAPASAPYNSTYAVVATTNASTTPTFTATPATVCSISGTTVTMVSGTGTCSVAASWAADDTYKAATATAKTTASKLTPAVTFTGAPSSATYLSTFTVASSTNTSVTPTITATPGSVCAISSGVVTIKSGTGTCITTATWAANADYAAATLQQSTSAEALATTTTITSAVSGTNPLKVTVDFAVSNGTATPVLGNVTVTASSGELCTGTVTAGKCLLTFVAGDAGPQTLTATYAGNTNNATSTSAPFGVTVPKVR